MLTSTGRRVRGAATVLVLVALLAGSTCGDDDHFPFGPFRMYSTTTQPSGAVRSPVVEARDESGTELILTTRAFGLRPAEVLGQIHRFRSDPALLSRLADAYRAFRPDAPPLVEIRLVFRVHRLQEGKRIRTDREVVGSWARP